jgi:hypothetical protein
MGKDSCGAIRHLENRVLLSLTESLSSWITLKRFIYKMAEFRQVRKEIPVGEYNYDWLPIFGTYTYMYI